MLHAGSCSPTAVFCPECNAWCVSDQLAPTYMMQTTWLDDTINAVVAGLNTAVYIRDLSWRPAAGRRRESGTPRTDPDTARVHVQRFSHMELD